MKAIYFVGILAFFLITVSSASAETTFYLTDVNEPEFTGQISINVTFEGDTITVQDESPGLVGISNIDIKEIGIQLPAGVEVEDVIDDGATNHWEFYYGNFEESEFGHFNTQITKKPPKSKTLGPIVITLKQSITVLSINEIGNSIVVHISFGDDDDLVVGSTWVGGSYQIPEFPSVAIPVMAILGIILISQNRRKEK